MLKWRQVHGSESVDEKRVVSSYEMLHGYNREERTVNLILSSQWRQRINDRLNRALAIEDKI